MAHKHDWKIVRERGVYGSPIDSADVVWGCHCGALKEVKHKVIEKGGK